MLIFYDLETTGLNQYHDKITEICLIKQIPLDFNDEKFISYYAYQLTHFSKLSFCSFSGKHVTPAKAPTQLKQVQGSVELFLMSTVLCIRNTKKPV